MKAFVEKTWVWVALNTLFLLVGIVLFFWGMVDRAGYFNVYWHTRYYFFIGWLCVFLIPATFIGIVVGVLGYRASKRAVASTGTSDGATVTPGNDPGPAPGEASRSIETLIADATADAAGVTPAQREFSAKMLTGMGLTEQDLRKVWPALDFARMLPGFPAMVEIHLRLCVEAK